MINTGQAQHELNTIKKSVIGIFKRYGHFYLVLSSNKNVIDIIYITQFGIIQKEYSCPIEFGKLILFPDGKNMNEMLNDIFEWDAFMKQFN